MVSCWLESSASKWAVLGDCREWKRGVESSWGRGDTEGGVGKLRGAAIGWYTDTILTGKLARFVSIPVEFKAGRGGTEPNPRLTDGSSWLVVKETRPGRDMIGCAAICLRGVISREVSLPARSLETASLA